MRRMLRINVATVFSVGIKLVGEGLVGYFSRDLLVWSLELILSGGSRWGRIGNSLASLSLYVGVLDVFHLSSEVVRPVVSVLPFLDWHLALTEDVPVTSVELLATWF